MSLNSLGMLDLKRSQSKEDFEVFRMQYCGALTSTRHRQLLSEASFLFGHNSVQRALEFSLCTSFVDLLVYMS